MRARILEARILEARAAINPAALVAQPHHFIDEGLLSACRRGWKTAVGGIGHIALIDRTIVEELRLVAHSAR